MLGVAFFTSTSGTQWVNLKAVKLVQENKFQIDRLCFCDFFLTKMRKKEYFSNDCVNTTNLIWNYYIIDYGNVYKL